MQASAEELVDYDKREQELLGQLCVPLNSCIEQIINKMKADHEDLLHHQMALLRRTYPQAMTRQQSGNYDITLSPTTDAVSGSVQTVSGDVQTATPIFIVTQTNSDNCLLSTAPKAGIVTCEENIVATTATVSSPRHIEDQTLSLGGVGVGVRTEDVLVTTSATDHVTMVVSAVDTPSKHEIQQNANCITLHPQIVSSVLPSGEYPQLLENNCSKKRGHVEDATSNGPTLDTKRHKDDTSL